MFGRSGSGTFLGVKRDQGVAPGFRCITLFSQIPETLEDFVRNDVVSPAVASTQIESPTVIAGRPSQIDWGGLF